MKKCIIILFSIMFFLRLDSLAQNNDKLTINELEYSQIFENFKSFIVTSIDKNIDIADTVNAKFILLHYVMSEYDLDSLDNTHFKKNEIPPTEFKCFLEELGSFYNFLFEKRKLSLAQHLSAIPLRLSSDKCMYEKLKPFQRENTFVYFDDRNPEKPLGYMLFVPKFKKTITASRIWSWTLMFQSGYWAFKSTMGTVGMEYFVAEGVKGPKPENRIGN